MVTDDDEVQLQIHLIAVEGDDDMMKSERAAITDHVE
jgi:hypothetical protein